MIMMMTVVMIKTMMNQKSLVVKGIAPLGIYQSEIVIPIMYDSLTLNFRQFILLQLPDLMHSESLHTDALITFILQNAGLLLGFGIMLLIAVYEEELRALKF